MARWKNDDVLRVSPRDIEQMISAAAVIHDCGHELSQRDTNLLSELLAGSTTITEWRHYPEGEVYDSKSHSQFFFHAHAGKSQTATERGHFHTFLRAEGMPIGVAPLLLPEFAVPDVPTLPPQAPPLKRGTRDEVSHLIAIAVDFRGEPVRLFTTNRWVTGETWYPVGDVIQMLDRFQVAEQQPAGVVNRWISAMVQLFRPQISSLLRIRDQNVMSWRRRHRTQVFEDPLLEVTSSLDIDLDSQLAFLERFRSGPVNAIPPRKAALPPMAEGWGDGHAG